MFPFGGLSNFLSIACHVFKCFLTNLSVVIKLFSTIVFEILHSSYDRNDKATLEIRIPENKKTSKQIIQNVTRGTWITLC